MIDCLPVLPSLRPEWPFILQGFSSGLSGPRAGDLGEAPQGESVCGPAEVDDGGGLRALGTGRRAVKCLDPPQDHQQRKRWAGPYLPIKNESVVIEEDQIPL